MKAKDILQLLSGLGITLSVKTLALLALALPLVVALALKLNKEYRKRVQQKRARGPAYPTARLAAGPNRRSARGSFTRVGSAS